MRQLIDALVALGPDAEELAVFLEGEDVFFGEAGFVWGEYEKIVVKSAL